MDIPLVLLEAMAQQTALIISDIEPLRETLGSAPEANGGLVVAPSGGHLADAMATLLDDDAFRERLGRAGREHVRAHHDASAECPRYADVYSSLL
jgi:glycosyltransferase involved in cell wall biosynthesis